MEGTGERGQEGIALQGFFPPPDSFPLNPISCRDLVWFWLWPLLAKSLGFVASPAHTGLGP